MSTKYILDGYNVIGKIAMLSEIKHVKGLAQSREALAMMVADIKHQRAQAEFNIIFDGRDGIAPVGSNTILYGIKCIFTHSNEEADDRISVLLRNSQNVKEIVVVSDDNKVRNSCKAYGASIQPSSFLLERKIKKLTKSTDLSEKSLSQSEINELNSYLKNVWGIR